LTPCAWLGWVARFISDGREAETVLWERSVVEQRYDAVMEVVRDGLPVTGIIQRFTKVRSPTKTGKIERFHKTIQAELLTGRVFDDLAQAQAAVDTWVAGYNTRRPHQALAMQARPSGLPSHKRPSRRQGAGVGAGGRRSAQFRMGTAWAGRLLTVRVGTELFHVYCDGVLLKTVPRTTRNDVVRFGPTRPPRQRPGHVKHQANREGRGCRVPGP
jgi:hypothetical protein